ncbi:TIGR03084 family metal-binding protein [Actinomadura flavalba]|uniref:TIGR03084 family metal-binding protein n=1 Tax=Actinomadura flavalba TaxID=1120938 RepID=UPI00039EB2EE|nr:TIGR03084 family metal-binding protein [Actinomadura flavalba]
MPDLDSLLTDLAAEGEALDALVGPLAPEAWATPTPAAGWTIAHQIAHLLWTDEMSVLAATDADGFAKSLEGATLDLVERGAEEGARRDPADLLASWRQSRRDVVAALAAVPAGTRVPWYGPPMGAASMATARLMETWAHGLDVADALGAVVAPTDRLRHVAHIGVRARDFAYLNRGLTPPAEPFRITIDAPSGAVWTWGPDDAAQSVRGPALDFALLVTRRRHPADLAVRADGPDSQHWLTIAQAFAGPPGDDPRRAG